MLKSGVFFVSFGLSTPCLLILIYLPGHLVYLSAFLAGGLSLASMPLIVALGQTLAPKGRSMVSSLLMGLTVGTGGLLTPLTGVLGDIFGIKEVLAAVALVPLIAIPVIARLPKGC